MFESWAGERLVLEKAVPSGRRAGRPISVSVVPVGPGIEMWRPCRFLGCILRFLAGLSGGLCRFLPCCIGAHHCRLGHVGWEKCGHDLTSRPRETSDPGVVESLLQVFGYFVGCYSPVSYPYGIARVSLLYVGLLGTAGAWLRSGFTHSW